jgi:GNAT superfamily N-acetyltransferase
MSQFDVRPMPRAELDLAIERAAGEGWNPGYHDAACFWAIDPGGFFMGVLDGRVIGRAMAVAYDDRFAFCGLYIVDPEYRGHGYGMAITRARLDYIGERNAGLDGVVDMQDKYKRLGYRMAHRSIRFGFTPDWDAEPEAPGAIRPAASVPFADLLAYDARHFPALRASFLERWIAQPGAVALAAVRDGAVIGYGVLRQCRVGAKIGPLFADDRDTGEALFRALCVHGRGAPVYMDIPQPNTAAMDLARRHGMRSEFECARMYLRGDPGLPLDRIYGITTFEAG